MPGHSKADEGRELLGLAEIGVGRLGQALAFERNDALIALRLGAAVDGHGEMTLAEQLRDTIAAAERSDAVGGEARIAAQLPGT